MNSTAMVIVAAGDGTRFAGKLPKAYTLLAGKPLVQYSVEQCLQHAEIDRVVVVYQQGHEAHLQPLLENFPELLTAQGGATRQISVRNGLAALAEQAPDYVMVHDAARPFLSAPLLDRLLQALKQGHQAVIPTIPVQNTLKQVENQQVTHTPDRRSLQQVQTPQAFAYPTIQSLHQQVEASDAITDDAMLAEQGGIPVVTVAGERQNIKITYPEDIILAEQQMITYENRVGFGYDVHKLVPHEQHIPNRHRLLRICGVDIPHDKKLLGHSDADVGLHALTDALLGALALGDIGQHFPPSDPRWRGADSTIFLMEAYKLLKDQQGKLINADITLIAESPKMSPHRDKMRERIAALLHVPIERISVKATTNESVGFIGREEAIAGQAMVSVMVPAPKEEAA
jgi:2-C-methyl-D-erythritol 4-phosphate cytidylyltransferase/2-C-methyl-D-erythritol 2,4-cyclodiphosphate synthase